MSDHDQRECARKLAAYIHETDYSTISHEAIFACKLHMLDTIGVALAGTRTPWAIMIADYVRSRLIPGKATILGSWESTQSTQAALVNGTSSHSLDYDDDPGICHIGSVIIPTAIAVAEEKGISGPELITAVNVGYDIITRVEEAFNGENMFARGFHPTSVCGVFGAAAAASKILGLDEKQIANAFGIAGSFASGLMEFLEDGSMIKRLHPGWAAQSGINAAYIAARGFTGPQTVFEGRFGLKAFSGSFDQANLIADLGKRFDILNSSMKKYPSCLYNAPAIDGILELRESDRIDPENVKKIVVRVRKVALHLVGEPIERKQNPENVLDAQMSMPFSVAVALIEGEPYLEQFTEQKIKDPKIIDLAKRVWVSADPGLDKLPANELCTILDVELNDGKRVTKTVEYYRGHPRSPLTKSDVLEKFSKCASVILESDEVEWLASRIFGIDRINDVRNLFQDLKS